MVLEVKWTLRSKNKNGELRNKTTLEQEKPLKYIVLGKLNCHMPKNEIDQDFTPYTVTQKLIKYMNVRCQDKIHGRKHRQKYTVT